MPLKIINKRLQKLADKETAKTLQKFFKTGPGEYGEGDVFLGIRVPELRKLAKKHQDIPTEAAVELLIAPIHEKRLLALFIIIHKYNQGNANKKKEIKEHYRVMPRTMLRYAIEKFSESHRQKYLKGEI